MPQDQLTRNERIRLEALAQANARFAMAGPVPPEQFFQCARDFEKFIREADTDHPAQ